MSADAWQTLEQRESKLNHIMKRAKELEAKSESWLEPMLRYMIREVAENA